MAKAFSAFVWLIVCGALLALSVQSGLANPFGPAVPVEPVPAFGFDQLIRWTADAQGRFYDGLTGALAQVATSSTAFWSLLGLSFAYGVAHAAGPGHGKIVISSYMLASGETARRGAMLALGSGLVQASMAVLLVGLLAGLFGASRAVLSGATITLERFSYALIIALGLYLLYRSVRGWFGAGHDDHSHEHHHGHEHHEHHHHDGHEHHHHPDPHHVHDDHCGCDHAHMPDAQTVAQTRGLGQTAALVFGAGMRPCTGALLVLVLALSQGLFWHGAAAAFAMGIGTALMVGTLAAMAGVLAGFLKSDHSHRSGFAAWALQAAPRLLSLFGGVLVVGLGALLLAASLAR